MSTVTKEQELLAQENKVLDAMAADASLSGRLRPVGESDLTPGLVLLYHLGEEYGCHIVRAKGDAYTYKDPAGLREAVKEGQFLTLEDDIEI